MKKKAIFSAILVILMFLVIETAARFILYVLVSSHPESRVWEEDGWGAGRDS